jgi:hypothetical protein
MQAKRLLEAVPLCVITNGAEKNDGGELRDKNADVKKLPEVSM